jgi:hypothetical protein
MQTIIEHGVFLYIWVFMMTSVMLFMEINASRKAAEIIHKTKPPTWNIATVMVIFAFALVPPVGWAMTWLVRRHRNQAIHAMERLDV